MATDAQFKYHRSYMGTRQILEARKRLADAGRKRISPEDYLNPKMHYKHIPEGSVGKAGSHEGDMWEKPDQDFDTYASDWEKEWSTLAAWGGRAEFIPVVNQDMTVTGHYGSVGGGDGTTNLIIRRDHVPADAVLQKSRDLKRRAPNELGPISLPKFETFYTDDLNAFLELGVEAYVHRCTETPPPGFIFCDMLTSQHQVWVETLMDGQVSSVVEVRSIGHLVPLPSAILDVLLAARALVKFQLHGSRTVEALQIKATNYRQARAHLAGPTAKAADDAMSVRKRVEERMKALQAKKAADDAMDVRKRANERLKALQAKRPSARSNMSAPIKGKPDATDPPARAREQRSADTFSKQPDVTEVYMGQELKTKYKVRVGEKFPDVVAEKSGGRYGLGEGKGTGMQRAKEQFEAAGQKLGPGKIAEQHVVIEKHRVIDGHTSPGPGFRVDARNRLEEFNSATGQWDLVTPNGKPIDVILMGP